MITNTYTMIAVIQKLYPVVQFFKNRYFPDGKVYYSDKALIETKRKGRRVAPFVVPVVDGIVMESEGYQTYEIEAPYIIPKKTITPADIKKKAFGEDPNSGRTPADRAYDLEKEYLDDLRLSIMRRWELMCTEIITTGKVYMKHFATAEDAAKDVNYREAELQYYKDEFSNKYTFPKDWASMTIQEKVQEFYKIAQELHNRGVKCTDIVMTSDVSMGLMTDKEFMEFYKYNKVDIGTLKPEELPAGIVFNGTININGILMNLFTYDSVFENMDGSVKEFLPAGTIAFLEPGMGETVYCEVTFLEDDKDWHSYAQPIVPRFLSDERNNVMEIQEFSRPVPFPHDQEGWMVANIYDKSSDTGDTDISTLSLQEPFDMELKTADEINAMKKEDIVAYAESIGLDGLSEKQKLDELKAAVLNFQEETYEE